MFQHVKTEFERACGGFYSARDEKDRAYFRGKAMAYAHVLRWQFHVVPSYDKATYTATYRKSEFLEKCARAQGLC